MRVRDMLDVIKNDTVEIMFILGGCIMYCGKKSAFLTSPEITKNCIVDKLLNQSVVEIAPQGGHLTIWAEHSPECFLPEIRDTWYDTEGVEH